MAINNAKHRVGQEQMKISNKCKVIKLIISCLITNCALAQKKSLTPQQIVRLNHFSPAETASSHGAIGYNLGAGIQRITDYKEDTVTAGRIFVTKGLDLPLDIGFSIGTIVNSSYTLLGTYGQYSIFEKFKWPSLSVRGVFSTIIGGSQSNHAIELAGVASYGFLRYFNLYAYTSIQRSKIEKLPASLNLLVDSRSINKINYDLHYAYGIELKLLNPLYKISFESSKNLRDEESILIKLGHGF